MWPSLPYKGLRYYEASDRALFAGRDDDVWHCAYLLDRNSTRLLILHGGTACGKSSFLRAGLIPFLETEAVGFQFLKTGEGRDVTALFIRSTDKPLFKLSESLYSLASQGFPINTPRGPRRLNLSSALFRKKEFPSFQEAVASDPALLIKVLHRIAGILPKTLVLVIDQAEEVLTLSHKYEGEKFRRDFFDLLSLFSQEKFDLKILLSIRTEFYGRLLDMIRRHKADIARIRDYMLGDLTREQLIEAITRPTSTDLRQEIIRGDGQPRKYYRFFYEPNLVEKITDDLLNTPLVGGILPVMQLFCDRLYKTIKEKPLSGEYRIVKERDYRELGSIEWQIDAYLEGVINSYCEEKIPKVRAVEDTNQEAVRLDNFLFKPQEPDEVKQEIGRWKDLLSDLTKLQVDGSVTTDLRSSDELIGRAQQLGCRIDFQQMMDYLSNDRQGIIRQVEVINLETKKPVLCFSLGHEAIGLVLQRWKAARQNLETRVVSLQKVYRHVGFLSLREAILDDVSRKFRRHSSSTS